MFPETMSRIGQMDRPASYFRVLLHLTSVLDPIQFRRVSAREVAEATGLHQNSAEKALAMLEADGAIHCSGRTGAKARRLNNTLLWASRAERYNETRSDPEVSDARGRP